MTSIKSKTIAAYSGVFLIMAALLITVIIVKSNLLDRYEQINEYIVYEQKLNDAVSKLAGDSYNGFKTNDYSAYNQGLKEIEGIKTILDTKISLSNNEIKTAYRGIINSLNSTIGEIEIAQKNTEGKTEILDISTTFNIVSEKFGFVKQNIVDLIILETQELAKTTQEIQKTRTSIDYIMVSAIILIMIGSMFFAFIFIKSITNPLVVLSDKAKLVSGGNLNIVVGKNLIERKDEIGILASSFSNMILNLSGKIAELENSKKMVVERTKESEKQLEELNTSKTVMLNLLEDSRVLEENLKIERDRVSTIISSMGDGLIVFDKNSVIILANIAASKILNIPLEKMHGQKQENVYGVYVGKEEMALEKRPLMKALKGETAVVGIEDDVYAKSVSGKIFPVAAVLTPLYNDNEIIGVVLVFRDLSEEKKLEEARINFISISSHQLRTPLTSMRWFAEMLIGGDAGPITEEQKHFVERIYQGTDRMINLVNILLQIARVEAGRVKIEPTLLDIKQLTKGVIISLQSQLEAKTQKVEIITVPEELPKLMLDQDLVWQAIQNFLTNAIRYSPENSVIKVSILQKGDFIEYSVKDQGIGIPEDQKSNIFEKFFRANNALKMVPEGSGLGLSLVKSLVTGWGGKIWFESEEKKGATFYFTVPLSGMKPKEGEVKLTV